MRTDAFIREIIRGLTQRGGVDRKVFHPPLSRTLIVSASTTTITLTTITTMTTTSTITTGPVPAHRVSSFYQTRAESLPPRVPLPLLPLSGQTHLTFTRKIAAILTASTAVPQNTLPIALAINITITDSYAFPAVRGVIGVADITPFVVPLRGPTRSDRFIVGFVPFRGIWDGVWV